MARRILLAAVGIVTLILAGCFSVEPTRAVDIHCIDASKYKYLWKLFENNQQGFAEFLKVSPSQLPAPEMCRAILIKGTIGPLTATSTSDDLFRDFDQLLSVIATNNGWIAEIYLASPGGNLVTGMALGELARTFWLKTVAVDNGFLEYVSDFVALTTALPGSGEAVTRTSGLEWQAYSTATRGLSHIRLESGQALCASSCASLFVGGVDRRGITYVHRARLVGTPARTLQIPTFWSLSEGQKPEGFILAIDLAYLQHMDAGIDLIRATQSTPANKLSPAGAPRFPSLISDILISQCDVNADELKKQETYIRAALTKATAKGGNRETGGRLQIELTSVGRQRANLEGCIATIHERKRLAQFAKYCSGRNCDQGVVREEINRQLSAGLSRPMAERGYAGAQYNVGVVYANGQGVPQDYVEAAKWCRLAADQGLAVAQYTLGWMYANGQGVKQDYVEAAKWYRLAADQAYAAAQYRLAIGYANGQGVRRDYVEAAKWNRLAADRGYEAAQYALGWMYVNGLGVPQDYVEAAKWYRLAADQGLAVAQYTVGLMYSNGQGLPRDYVRAHMWLNLSAKKETENAERDRDLVAQRMSPEQIAEAEKLAREWKPTKPPLETKTVGANGLPVDVPRPGAQ
jgi:uncharacterized protein